MSAHDLPKPWSVSRRRALQAAGAATAIGVPVATSTAAEAATAATGAADHRGHQGSATLTEGTNLAVAVSPDGRRLALDLCVSIWVVDARGGTARRLTDDLQDATRPRWSPDGSTIAFQSYRDGNYHLWTIRPDGSGLRQHTRGRDDHREPHFTPDGTALVFSSDRAGKGSYDIYRLDIATGAITALTESDTEDAEPTVSPDGATIAFTVDSTRIDEVDLAGGARRTVVAARTGVSMFGPQYGPDGTLAYVALAGATSDLYVGTTKVTDGEDVFGLPPSWASATELFYTSDGKIKRRQGTTARVVEFTATVGVTARRPAPRRPDLDSTRRRQALGIASPTVSPDGRRLAFRALNALWLARTDGRGRPERIVADGYFNSDPDFSPDGRSLLYASDRDGTADLWLRDLRTGRNRLLTELPGAQTAPRFSPDGTQIAYQDQDGIAWVVDTAGGTPRQLTPTLFQPGRVSWSRDGRTIVLAAVKPFSKRFREGTSQLLYVDVATTALEYVAPMPYRSLATRGDDGPVFSPDGKHLAFVVESLLYVVPVDARGRFTGQPRAVTREATDSPVWLDRNTLLYLNNGRLRRTGITGGRARTVQLDLSYRRAQVDERVTIHAGALWDGRAKRLREDVDVVVDGNRIAAVRPHHGGRAHIDASDLTVMPGLIDAHNHWHLRGRAWGARQGLLWLSYGITTTRSPGDPAYQMQETREALTAGSLTGPRYFATGEAIDGSRVYYNFMRPTLSVEQLELEIDRVAGLGYDLVKTYVRLPIELQRRAIAAVHRLGLKLSSHYLYPAERLGMDGMEHTGATNRLGYSHTVSRLGRAYADVVTLFTKAGLSVTPTLFNSTMAHVDDPSLLTDPRTTTLYPEWEYKALLAEVETARGPAGVATRALLAGNVDMVLRIHRGGGFVIAGTDSPLDNIAVSLHANLRSMVAGGFTPYEALTTATVNPARWLNLEGKLGVVAPGAQADLAFVRGNPLADIRAAAAVERVMVAGESHTVDELLRPYAAPAARPAVAAVAHSHEDEHWWHEPERFHRYCCEG